MHHRRRSPVLVERSQITSDDTSVSSYLDLSCSRASSDEPLAGTAPVTSAWLIVENPGPWGRKALTDSHLPAEVVAHISSAMEASSLTFLAARHPSRRSLDEGDPRYVWLAYCDSTAARTEQVMIFAYEDILTWDLEGLAHGRMPVSGKTVSSAQEFVCTNSKRDACCAIEGRKRVEATSAWECSHLGGHRFAATSLFLPSGRIYGRLGVTSYPDEPPASHLRGACYLPRPAQAAECAVRCAADISPSAALECTILTSSDRYAQISIVSPGDREWTVTCRAEDRDGPVSCGADSERRLTWRAEIISDNPLSPQTI